MILSALIGIVNFGLGFRSEGEICLAASLYLLISRSLQRKYSGGCKLRFRTIAVIAASLIVGVLGVSWVYGYAARTGAVGEEVRARYERQSSGKYGVLLRYHQSC